MALKSWAKYVFDLLDLNSLSGGEWTESSLSSGSDEYYYTGSDVSGAPLTVYEDGSAMPLGTIGALAEGEWAWGDEDSLGSDTIYVRLNNSGIVDPDGQPAGFLQCPDIYEILQGGAGNEVILIEIMISNTGNVSMDYEFLITDSSDVVKAKWGQTITVSDGPLMLLSKLVLGDEDKIKMQCTRAHCSIHISGDES